MLAVAAHALEAARAIHRLVGARLERHVGGLTALRTDGGEHLAAPAAIATTAVATGVVRRARARPQALLAGRPTLGAAPRLVGEALLGEELLLTGREGELPTTLAAHQGSVNETHECLLL